MVTEKYKIHSYACQLSDEANSFFMRCNMWKLSFASSSVQQIKDVCRHMSKNRNLTQRKKRLRSWIPQICCIFSYSNRNLVYSVKTS